MSSSFQILILTPSIEMFDMRACVSVQDSTSTPSNPSTTVTKVSMVLIAHSRITSAFGLSAMSHLVIYGRSP
jgi:hypothetical protein